MKKTTTNSSSLNWQFIALAIVAFIVSYIPFVNWPFSWINTFFHEISHGLMAVVTGGSISTIEIHLRGSGLCYTVGGSRFLTAFAGYVGAVFWGGMMFQMAKKSYSAKATSAVAIFFCVLVAGSGLLYARDVVTLSILGFIFVLFISIIKLQHAKLMQYALQFVGVYVVLDALHAPLNLLDGRHHGDGATLANLTGIPEMFWVALWIVIALAYIYYLAKDTD